MKRLSVSNAFNVSDFSLGLVPLQMRSSQQRIHVIPRVDEPQGVLREIHVQRNKLFVITCLVSDCAVVVLMYVLTQVAGQCSKLCHLENKNLNVITVVMEKRGNYEVIKAIRDEERHEEEGYKENDFPLNLNVIFD